MILILSFSRRRCLTGDCPPPVGLRPTGGGPFQKVPSMQTVPVPWSAWYNTRKFDLTFPDAWQVTVANMKGGTDIGDEGIRASFAAPVGSPPLGEIATGGRSAAILVDDLSRPTPAYRLLPYILEELAGAGYPGGPRPHHLRPGCPPAAHA